MHVYRVLLIKHDSMCDLVKSCCMSDVIANNVELLYTPELRGSGRWMDTTSMAKIPLTAGYPINALDPKNWKRFIDLKNPRHACLAIGIPLIASDFDWKTEVNGKYVEDAEKKARSLKLLGELPKSYAEKSLSGFGVHVFHRVQPENHSKLPDQVVGEFEVYTRKRQFRMTGNIWPSAIPEVTDLTLAEALEIFHLANPVVVAETNKIVRGEPGYWDETALLAMLDAFRKHVPNFWFKPCRHGYAVPCPGELGWPCGAKHSSRRLVQNSLIWVGNGHRRWECFHAHCSAKTTLDWLKFYDPLQVLFNHDEWEADEIRRLGLDGGAL